MKSKKFLSVLLAAAMVVGSVQVPAASVEVNAAEEKAVEPAPFDPSKVTMPEDPDAPKERKGTFSGGKL